MDVPSQPHHQQLELCTKRLAYRQGAKLTAVKVYTINDESNHILIFGVPAIQLADNVKKTCQKYGFVKSVELIKNYPNIESFTEAYHVCFLKLSSARYAKQKLDTRSYYGSILHVCYAPELETIKETRLKIKFRRQQVQSKLKKLTQFVKQSSS